MKDACYQILTDGRWHGCADFVHLGLSYRNRLNELKQEGEESGRFTVLSERDGRHPTYRYRMLRPETKPVKVKQNQPSLFGRETLNKIYQ